MLLVSFFANTIRCFKKKPSILVFYFTFMQIADHIHIPQSSISLDPSSNWIQNSFARRYHKNPSQKKQNSNSFTAMSQKQYKYSAPAMLSVIAIISTLSVVLHIRSTSEDYHSETRQTSQQPKRVAIVRPFSPRRAAAITQTFDAWNEYSPCQPQYPDLDSGDTKHEIPIQYDLFLSYSQAYNGTDEAARKADQSTQYLMDNFESFPWSTCFQNVYRIEMNIPKNEDLYLPAEKDNPLWVNGPNQQFLRGMEIIKHHHHKVGNDVDTSTASYDYVVVMESDVTPIKPNWLVDLIREANENEFCMLGSKYAGDAWDLFRSSLPLALQHHLNGNAVYNLHHPLMQFLLQQLWDERGTIYKAVPYDYRISQILVQGFLGVEPDLPPGIMSKKDFAFETRDDKARTRKFENMWNEYGTVDGEAVMRESKVIQNFVGSALLPRQLKAMDASLVHGAMLYSGWEDYKYVSACSSICKLYLLVLSGCEADFPFFSITCRTLPWWFQNGMMKWQRTS